MNVAYRALVGLARLLTPILAHGQSKLARGLRARRSGGKRLIEWGHTARDPGRPTVWFHASSVGETLQARAVSRALCAEHPEVQVVFTYFSPSAEAVATEFGADEWDSLPWDAMGPVQEVVSAVDPALLVFTQREVWPVLTQAVHARGGRVALIAGTLPSNAGRLRGPARRTLSRAMSQLSLVAAIDRADGERFLTLGTPPGAIDVTGDPGVDAARQRLEAGMDGPLQEAPALAPFSERVPTIVAGSTWPEDESVLCPALEAYSTGAEALRVIVAPHEPTEAAVAKLSRRLQEGGWRVGTLTSVEARGASVGVGEAVVVDRVGVLASLYRVATVAFVGGGFGDDGLHSVLEPAAAGVPCAFGPRGHSLAAGALLRGGGAREVRDTAALTRVFEEWLGEDDSRVTAGASARDYIHRQSGAAIRSAELLATLLAPVS